MLWFIVAALSVVFLAHTAPFPFLLEAFSVEELALSPGSGVPRD